MDRSSYGLTVFYTLWPTLEHVQAPGGAAPLPRTGSRDEFMTRLSCARTASLALSVVQMPVEEKVNELFHLAEELENWVNRTAKVEEEPSLSSPERT